MTTFNAGQYLTAQLQSLLNQTRCPDEVIICDDGSADDTVSVVKQFIQDHNPAGWQIICNTENLGYIRNFHKAISLTHGDVVFLCDQDDIWDPDKIQKMVAAMESDAGIEALASGYCYIDSSGAALEQGPGKFYSPPRHAGLLSRVEAGHVFHYNTAQGCACCYRRSLIDRYCQIPCGRHLPHDWVLNLLAYQKDAFYFWNEPLLHYRLHGDNAIGAGGMSRSLSQRTDRIQARLKCIEEIPSLPISAEDAEEFQKIVTFLRLRIQIQNEKNLILWLKTFVAYYSLIRKGFILQYMKDLIVLPLSGAECPKSVGPQENKG